jgi:hypothetical protein
MALRVEVLEDGTLHYITDGHALVTGAHQGHVTVADGTVYNVTPAVIEVHPDHVAELAAELDRRHAAKLGG